MLLTDSTLDVEFFFFFQAEDGIRDWSVTGVQTCALPTSPTRKARAAHHPAHAFTHEQDRADERGQGRHQTHVEILDVAQLMADYRLELFAVADLQQPARHRDMRVMGTVAGRKGVRVVVGDDPDLRPGYPGGDRHFVDDVDDLPLRVGFRIDQLLRAGRPQDLLRPGLVGVPHGEDRDRCEHEADPRKRVMALERPHVVAAEAQPGKKQDEANHQPGRAPAIGFLLLKEITVGRGQPAVPPVPLDLRSPTNPSVARAPGPPRASWGIAAAWCCTASRCRCRAASRTRFGSPWRSVPPAAERYCRS